MRKALVCISARLDSAEELAQELRGCGEVKEVFLVQGVYDVVAKIEGETIDDIVDFINRRIKRLSRVEHTLSLISCEHEKRAEENDVILV